VSGVDILYTHVGADGSIAEKRALVAAPGGQQLTYLLADARGGFFAAWDDGRDPTHRIYVGHVAGDLAASRQPVVVRAEVVGGAAEIEWSASAGYAGTLERSTDGGAWTALEAVSPDIAGRIVFHDSSVQSLHSYCYRLTSQADPSGATIAACVTIPVPPLGSAQVHAEGFVDRVEIEWSPVPLAFAGTVWRQPPGGEWAAIGTVTADDAGRAVYRDRDVRHERRYSYRLVDSADARDTSIDTSVFVPPASISLVAAHGAPHAVDATWDVGSLAFTGRAFRSSDATPWTEIAAITADGAGRVVLHDTDVSPLRRYCYRLADADNPATRSADACLMSATVEPIGLAVAPSPVQSTLTLIWNSGSTASARWTIYDVTGRVVTGGSVTPPASGAQLSALRLGPSVRSGVYVIELRHDDRVERARVAIVR